MEGRTSGRSNTLICLQKIVHAQASLAQNSTQRPLGDVPGVVGNGSESLCGRIEPDFMTPCGLPVKGKPMFL